MKKLILLLLFIPVISFGQDQKLKVYLDCRCDDNYIKQKTSFLEYVRDQDLADIEIIIRDIRTPTGTRSFEIQIDGNNEFKEISSSAIVSGFFDCFDIISSLFKKFILLQVGRMSNF